MVMLFAILSRIVNRVNIGSTYDDSSLAFSPASALAVTHSFYLVCACYVNASSLFALVTSSIPHS